MRCSVNLHRSRLRTKKTNAARAQIHHTQSLSLNLTQSHTHTKYLACSRRWEPESSLYLQQSGLAGAPWVPRLRTAGKHRARSQICFPRNVKEKCGGVGICFSQSHHLFALWEWMNARAGGNGAPWGFFTPSQSARLDTLPAVQCTEVCALLCARWIARLAEGARKRRERRRRVRWSDKAGIVLEVGVAVRSKWN